jgi:hypothetical protein
MQALRSARWSLGTCVLCLAACAPAPSAPPQPAAAPLASQKAAPTAPATLAEEPEPVAAGLRTGRIAPVEHAETLALKVRRHALDGDEQLLEVVLPEFASESPGDLFWLNTEARLTGSRAPFQLVSRGKNGEMLLWLRRAKSEAAGEIAGDAYTPAVGAQPGHHFRFRAPAPSGAASPELVASWATAASEYLTAQPGVFGSAAASRLRAHYKLPGNNVPTSNGASHDPQELALLMDTFTGRSAVQEALASRRNGIFSAAKLPRAVPIAQLKGPELAQHPWAQLSKRLGAKQAEEPLAKAVPADFYFARARSFAAFTEMLGFVQGFGAPAADLFDRASSERGTQQRYLAELGVETSDLSRVLGPEVVEDFAVTGSDPYLHEGSDVTLIFRLKSPLLFRAALHKALATHGAAHGGTQASAFAHEGVTVNVARSPDGRVRQHHAAVAELELVSNSPAAIRRVISTIQGKAPQLADEPDFRYMLARDADVPADLLAFIGDRFVSSVVGPAQKIAEARRQVALAELTSAPVAALLYGWVHGKSPSDRQELLRSGLLAAVELKHHDGARIEWAPSAAARSTWGTPAALEPLIDLPAVVRVSSAERDSYAQFAQQYQRRWGEYIDPIALRVSSTRRGDGKNLHAELRVLPLVPAERATSYDLSGDGRVAPAELPSGARFTLAVGEYGYLRDGLGRLLSAVSRDAEFQLDWLGDYAMLGVADRTELLVAARSARGERELPIERPASAEEMGRSSAARSDLDLIAGLPVYAVVGLRSRVAAAVALTAARHLAESTAPGAFEWAPFAAHRGVEVVRILARERGREVALFYAMAGDALLVTLNRSVMRGLIEQALDGKLPAQNGAATSTTKDGQAVFELAPLKKGPLRSILASALAAAALESAPSSRAAAEAVLRGVPESAHKPDRSAELSLAYLGTIPLTPDGRRYALAPEGIVDPLRGSQHAPEWPALPVAESSADRVLSAFLRLRSDLSFDEEPQPAGVQAPSGARSGTPRLRSLRARLDLTLR